MLFVGRAQYLTFVRTGGAQQPFKVHTGDHVLYFAVAEVAPRLWIKYLITRGQDDSADLDFHLLRFLMKIDGVILTDALADAAFFIFQVKAVFMDIGDQGNRLRKIDMDRLTRRQVLIVGIRDLDRAVLDAGTTARAFVLDNVSGLFIQGDLEVSCFPFYTVNFSIGQDLYIGMPADLDQFGREYSHGAVIRGIGLVKLGHLAANGR